MRLLKRPLRQWHPNCLADSTVADPATDWNTTQAGKTGLADSVTLSSREIALFAYTLLTHSRLQVSVSHSVAASNELIYNYKF